MYVLDIYNRNLKEPAMYINPMIVFTRQKFFVKFDFNWFFRIFGFFNLFCFLAYLRPIGLNWCVIRLSNNTNLISKLEVKLF